MITDQRTTYAITAQHGWGYDWRTFATWQPEVPQNWRLILKNRGYFQNTSDKTFASSETEQQATKKILVCHSFGLHLLSPEDVQKSDLLVIISSFEHFHVNNNPLSKIAITRMIKRFESEPQTVLQDFYAACTGDAKPLPDGFTQSCDIPLLVEDLKILNQAHVNLSAIEKAKSTLILHGGKDRIVPLDAAKQLNKKLSGSVLSVNDEAEHALPITHTRWCLDAIYEALER